MTDFLFAAPGGGSMLVEAAYALAGEPLDICDLEWSQDWALSPLAAINPLLQVPTLRLADGSVMTESAAILLHCAERFPHAQLAPPPGDPQRGEFLRWLLFYPSAIYPCYTFSDLPPRFVEGDVEAGEKLRRACDERLRLLYLQMEAAAREPFFLGQRMSAIDLYAWAANRWRPGREWFRAEAPKLNAIAAEVEKLSTLATVRARNIDGAPP